jgi:5-aminopentanamidase
MRGKVKIAAVQTNPMIMQVKDNLKNIISFSKVAAENGADLIVFPECALTGYIYESLAEAKPYAEAIPGPSTKELAACCKHLGVHIVVGLLEKDGDRYFNAAVLIGPGGLIGQYRKNHLPPIGIDRFLTPGDRSFEVHDTPAGKIGLHICYDCNFPESARVMALMGADILVLPTNWPQGREKVGEFIIRARAYENKVYLVAVDRVGKERGTQFIGSSRIIDPWGNVLAQASKDDEQIIYAEISLNRRNKIFCKAGENKNNYISDRRPELYSKIAESRKPLVK